MKLVNAIIFPNIAAHCGGWMLLITALLGQSKLPFGFPSPSEVPKSMREGGHFYYSLFHYFYYNTKFYVTPGTFLRQRCKGRWYGSYWRLHMVGPRQQPVACFPAEFWVSCWPEVEWPPETANEESCWWYGPMDHLTMSIHFHDHATTVKRCWSICSGVADPKFSEVTVSMSGEESRWYFRLSTLGLLKLSVFFPLFQGEVSLP